MNASPLIQRITGKVILALIVSVASAPIFVHGSLQAGPASTATANPPYATDRQLDVAINGPGYFKIKMPGAPGDVAYTRNGNFFVDRNGWLIVGPGEGHLLLPPCVIPPGTNWITIRSDGEIEVKVADHTQVINVGQLLPTRFANPQALRQIFPGVFVPTEASGPGSESYTGNPMIWQGFLEAPSGDVTNETQRHGGRS